MDSPPEENTSSIKKQRPKQRQRQHRTSRKLNLTPRHFSLKDSEWSSMKLRDLKQTCIRFGLHVSGTKPVLRDRICAHLKKEFAAICIQKRFRGFVEREMVRLKGPGYRNYKTCVNGCDFYSLDPLECIPNYQFFSYRDEKGFVYAFDLFSLMTMFAKNRKIVNPYNREEVPFAIICDIFSLFKKTLIYYPHSELATLNRKHLRPTQNNPEEIPRIVHATDQLFGLRNGRTISERIVQVFMEIDNLGNYTDHRWFLNLSSEQYIIFYRNYFTFWTGNQIPLDVRTRICALTNPFTAITLENIQVKCVELIEWMVYTGVDDEHRTLGALHVLSMLTIVSVRARRALPWLSI